MNVARVCKGFFYLILFLLIQNNAVAYTSPGANITSEQFSKIFNERNLAYQFFDYLQTLSNETTAPERIGLADLKCFVQLKELLQGITKAQLWALTFIDAWGNKPAGLLQGNLYDFGNFDECLGIQQPISNRINIKGKYCLATMPLLGFRTGVCMPHECSAAFVNSLFKQFFRRILKINLEKGTKLIDDLDCIIQQEHEPLTAINLSVIIILGIMGALITAGTLYDYWRSNENAQIPALLRAISLRHNARQLFRIVDYSKNPNVIPCLNGIRCLSIIWVVCCHDFQLSISMPNLNLRDVYDWIQTPFAMLITQGFLAVDSFFFLSALLLAMIFLREMDRSSGRINIPLMYLQRYLRLTPVVGFAILVYLSMKNLSNGPLWNMLGWSKYTKCKETWWRTLLYVQNYGKTDRMCLSFSWYLAVDMQLYILSPFVLIAIWKWGKKAVIATFILLLLTWACLFSTIMINDYSLFFKRVGTFNESFKHIYYPTHMRTSPWLIGIIFGYFLHKIKAQKLKLQTYQVLLGWLICLTLIATCIFSLYGKSQIPADPPLTTLEEACFVSLTRIAWPLALCWIVFASVQGYGGPINSFLGSPLWQPLARVSFCLYIFHCLIQDINAGRIRTNSRFSSYDVMLRIWQDFGFALLLSISVHLLIEAPFAGIVQSIFAGKIRKAKTNQNEAAAAVNSLGVFDPAQKILQIATVSQNQNDEINVENKNNA